MSGERSSLYAEEPSAKVNLMAVNTVARILASEADKRPCSQSKFLSKPALCRHRPQTHYLQLRKVLGRIRKSQPSKTFSCDRTSVFFVLIFAIVEEGAPK